MESKPIFEFGDIIIIMDADGLLRWCSNGQIWRGNNEELFLNGVEFFSEALSRYKRSQKKDGK